MMSFALFPLSGHQRRRVFTMAAVSLSMWLTLIVSKQAEASSTQISAGAASGMGARPDTSADEVLAVVDRILAPDQYTATIDMVATRPNGVRNQYAYRVYKSGPDLLLLTFDQPAVLAGHSVLRRADDMHRYIPSLKRAMRVSSRSDFESGDFRNADVLRMHLARDYRATSMVVEGEQLVLDLSAHTPEAGYDRIKLWVAKQDFMPLREELFSSSRKLLRTLELTDVRDFGGHRAPSTFVMRNEVAQGRSTRMTVKSLRIEKSIPESRFSIESMGR
jgi:outer membrane lipoprotein-sorting protein